MDDCGLVWMIWFNVIELKFGLVWLNFVWFEDDLNENAIVVT